VFPKVCIYIQKVTSMVKFSEVRKKLLRGRSISVIGVRMVVLKYDVFDDKYFIILVLN